MNVCKFLYDAPCCFALSVVPVRTQTTRYSGLSNSSRWGVDVGTELALQSKKSKFSPTRKMRCCRVFCSVTNVNTAHVSVSHPGRSTPVTIGGSRNYQLQLSLLCKQFSLHTRLIQPGPQLQAVLNQFQERSLLGLMREFTLTFMQWWGDACAQSQPVLHSAVMALLCRCTARLLASWRFWFCLLHD